MTEPLNKKIKRLLHLNQKKSYKILYSLHGITRGKILGHEEIIRVKSADGALFELKKMLEDSGVADYYVISVDQLD